MSRNIQAITRCRVCGCTDDAACLNACSWVERDLCSTCAVAAEALASWLYNAKDADKTALNREVEHRLKHGLFS